MPCNKSLHCQQGADIQPRLSPNPAKQLCATYIYIPSIISIQVVQGLFVSSWSLSCSGYRRNLFHPELEDTEVSSDQKCLPVSRADQLLFAIRFPLQSTDSYKLTQATGIFWKKGHLCKHKLSALPLLSQPTLILQEKPMKVSSNMACYGFKNMGQAVKTP